MVTPNGYGKDTAEAWGDKKSHGPSRRTLQANGKAKKKVRSDAGTKVDQSKSSRYPHHYNEEDDTLNVTLRETINRCQLKEGSPEEGSPIRNLLQTLHNKMALLSEARGTLAARLADVSVAHDNDPTDDDDKMPEVSMIEAELIALISKVEYQTRLIIRLIEGLRI